MLLRLRTLADDTDRAVLAVWPRRTREQVHFHDMTLAGSERGYDYYTAAITAEKTSLSYAFRIFRGDLSLWYGQSGLAEEMDDVVPFRLTADVHTPVWAQGAVFYQIFPDRFRSGDPEHGVKSGEYTYLGHPVERVRSWHTPPKPFDVYRFYGGDLAGIREKLPYLKDLGVEALYLNPVFVSPSNHRYDTADYLHVDPHLGGDEALADLIAAAHGLGIRVILDGVFNHCSDRHPWFDREKTHKGPDGVSHGAYADPESPYRDYFYFRDETAWPDNDTAMYWWGNSTLPKLAYGKSEELTEKILSAAEKWLMPPFSADGWRLDVAADIGLDREENHAFLRKLHDRIRKTSPEAFVLAEHYGSPEEWLSRGEWDSVMDYDAFFDPVSWLFTGMEKHSDRKMEQWIGDARSFMTVMNAHMAALPFRSQLCAMHELSNHDHSRFLTRTNGMVGRLDTLGAEAAAEGVVKAVFYAAVFMQMTWIGAPTVYYGDEAGQVGFTDPDNRRTYPWGREDKALIAYHRALIMLRNRYPVLRTGSFIPLAARDGCIVYGRFDEKGAAVLAVSAVGKKREFMVPVYPAGFRRDTNVRFLQVFQTAGEAYSEEPGYQTAFDGVLRIKLGPWGAKAYYAEYPAE